MKPEEFAKKIKARFGDAILETPPFGRARLASAWVEVKSLPKVTAALCSDPEFAFDELENLSVMEMEGSLVVSYFLVSSTKDRGDVVVLRASVETSRRDEAIDVPSVSSLWPMAQPYEREASELFGIRFDGKLSGSTGLGGPSGFPLRKARASR